VFLGVCAGLVLVLDVATKAWAEIGLITHDALDPSVDVIKDHLRLTLAYNKGGAWGILHDAHVWVRKPFFLLVSLLAVVFIVSLYRRLHRHQWALLWGLPLVLGGALGNLSDRVMRQGVVDFIDYRADWVAFMNETIARVFKGWNVTDHWPTFNVADVAICVGVGLMALDMLFGSKKPAQSTQQSEPAPGTPKDQDGQDAAARLREIHRTPYNALPIPSSLAPSAEGATTAVQEGAGDRGAVSEG